MGLLCPVPFFNQHMYTVTIPQQDYESIKIAIEGLPKGDKSNILDKTIYFVYHLYQKSINVSGMLGEPLAITRDEIRKILGRHTTVILKTLEETGVIVINHYYSKEKRKCKHYYIDSSKCEGPFYKIEINYEPKELIIHRTDEVLRRYRLSTHDAEDAISEYINDCSNIYSKALVDDQIGVDWLPKVRVYSLKNTGIFKWKPIHKIKRDFFLKRFHDPRCQLIKWNKRYYYMPLSIFIQERKRNIKFSYINLINRFNKNEKSCKKDNNGRLYSKITNVPKVLMPSIYHTEFGHDLEEWDLCCAQWVFFIYAVNNPELDNIISAYVKKVGFHSNAEDWQHFKSLVKTGSLYDYLEKKFLFDCRDRGKEICFEVLFGKVHKQDSNYTARFRTMFPTVLSIVEGIKNQHGFKSLPNELQSIEADIMISILDELQSDNLDVLSKHDAFIYPKAYNLKNRIRKMLVSSLGDIFIFSIKEYTPLMPHG
jgi:hypothetical protein